MGILVSGLFGNNGFPAASTAAQVVLPRLMIATQRRMLQCPCEKKVTVSTVRA